MVRYVNIDGIEKLFDKEFKRTRSLIKSGETHLDNLAEGFYEATNVLNRLPTEDVLPIGRKKQVIYSSNKYTLLQSLLGPFNEFEKRIKKEMLVDILDNLNYNICSLQFSIRDYTVTEICKETLLYQRADNQYYLKDNPISLESLKNMIKENCKVIELKGFIYE